jgi:ADP-heptose:LPS heptosyltransferase
VVSVQTSLAHLTGALAVPCLTLVPSHAEWRYMAEGPTMPWYRSVRLFRQPRAGEWASVVQAVAAEVAARV